jgi:Tol biopolymer transport system component
LPDGGKSSKLAALLDVGALMAGEIFISYRRADKAWAQLLHSQLRAEGVEPWFDAQVGPGADWRIATAKALQASRIFVLLFSANAAKSTDIAKELAAAVHEKKLIIPVRLEDIAPDGAFLYELASRNWINAYEDTEAKLAELAKGLAQMVRTGAQDESLLPFERAESSAKTARRIWLLAAAAITVIAASATATWLLWPERKWTVESSRSFISTMALEGEPAFSSDGKMLAYTSGADLHSRKIYMRNLAGGDAIKITNDPYDDVSPTWSPDGTRIAYAAQRPGESCRIMVATVPAGETRQVARCSRASTTVVSWQPGTSFLYYFDHVGAIEDFLFRLDLDSGALQQLPKASPALIVGIQHLQCSPDGKMILYVHQRSASTYDIVIRDLASGNEKILGTLVGAWLATWSEDSRTVLASTAHGIGSEITAYPVGGGMPYSVYTTTINASHLVAGKGGLLALETDTSRHNLARIRSEPATQPDITDPVNGKTWAPTFAPDGTLAFLSNRSGNNAVWEMKPGSAPAILFDAGLAPLFRLQFSPDGSRLSLLTAGVNMNVKIVTADGGTVASFDRPSVGFGNPTWTPDGKAVVLLDIPTKKVVRIAIDNPTQAVPFADAPPWVAFGFHDNRIFAPKADKGGIWEFAKVPRLINAKYSRQFASPVTFRGDDVLIPDFDAAGGARILAQPLAGGPDRVLGYAPGAEAQDRFFESKMAVNPKTGEVIYVAAVQGDTNIDLLTMARH